MKSLSLIGMALTAVAALLSQQPGTAAWWLVACGACGSVFAMSLLRGGCEDEE
jgi:hypothetical protein